MLRDWTSSFVKLPDPRAIEKKMPSVPLSKAIRAISILIQHIENDSCYATSPSVVFDKHIVRAKEFGNSKSQTEMLIDNFYKNETRLKPLYALLFEFLRESPFCKTAISSGWDVKSIWGKIGVVGRFAKPVPVGRSRCNTYARRMMRVPPEIVGRIVQYVRHGIDAKIKSRCSKVSNFEYEMLRDEVATDSAMLSVQKTLFECSLVNHDWYEAATPQLFHAPQFTNLANFAMFLRHNKFMDPRRGYSKHVIKIVFHDSWNINDANSHLMLNLMKPEVKQCCPNSGRTSASSRNSASRGENTIVPSPAVILLYLLVVFPNLQDFYLFHRERITRHEFAYQTMFPTTSMDKVLTRSDSIGTPHRTEMWAVDNINFCFFGRYFSELKSIVREVILPILPVERPEDILSGALLIPVLFEQFLQLAEGHCKTIGSFYNGKFQLQRLNLLPAIGCALTRCLIYEMEWQTMTIQNAFDEYSGSFYALMQWIQLPEKASAVDGVNRTIDQVIHGESIADARMVMILQATCLMLTTCQKRPQFDDPESIRRLFCEIREERGGHFDVCDLLMSVRGGHYAEDRLAEINSVLTGINDHIHGSKDAVIPDEQLFLLELITRLYYYHRAGRVKMNCLKKLLSVGVEKIEALRKIRL